MTYISRLSNEEIITFYKGLHSNKLIVSRAISTNDNNFVVAFDIKRVYSKSKPHKIVSFKDFEIEENYISRATKSVDLYSPADENKLWRIFMAKRFGMEYVTAYENLLKTKREDSERYALRSRDMMNRNIEQSNVEKPNHEFFKGRYQFYMLQLSIYDNAIKTEIPLLKDAIEKAVSHD